MSAWCPQRLLSCLLWFGLGVACVVGGMAEAPARRDVADATSHVTEATTLSFDGAACEPSTIDCPSMPAERHSDEPMKRRHVARRAVPVVDLTADPLHAIVPAWAEWPVAADVVSLPRSAHGVLPATRTTRNAQRRRYLRVLGGRAPPAGA